MSRPFAFNQIAGGKSPAYDLQELGDAGVSLVTYSTPCLFAAHAAVDDAMKSLRENSGLLQKAGKGRVGLKECTAILNGNLSIESLGNVTRCPRRRVTITRLSSGYAG